MKSSHARARYLKLCTYPFSTIGYTYCICYSNMRLNFDDVEFHNLFLLQKYWVAMFRKFLKLRLIFAVQGWYKIQNREYLSWPIVPSLSWFQFYCMSVIFYFQKIFLTRERDSHSLIYIWIDRSDEWGLLVITSISLNLSVDELRNLSISLTTLNWKKPDNKNGMQKGSYFRVSPVIKH